MSGSFLTSCEAELEIKLPKLDTTTHISAPFHVTDKNIKYIVFFGIDLLRELGMILDVQN